jgi:hypothetical protein
MVGGQCPSVTSLASHSVTTCDVGGLRRHNELERQDRNAPKRMQIRRPHEIVLHHRSE